MDGRKRTVQIKFRVTEAERDLILEKMKLVPTRNMAVTKIKPIKSTLSKALDYIENPDKTDGKIQAEKTGTSWKGKLKTNLDALILQVSSFEELLQRLQAAGYEIKPGKYVSCRAPGQERFTRLKTLGADYTEEAIRERIAGRRTKAAKAPREHCGVSLFIDIENSIKAAQSRGYEQWAKIHNLKQAAKTMNFLTENKIEQYADLVSRIEEMAAESGQAADALKNAEKRLADMAVLIKNVSTYQKTKPVYDAYRKARNKAQRTRRTRYTSSCPRSCKCSKGLFLLRSVLSCSHLQIVIFIFCRRLFRGGLCLVCYISYYEQFRDRQGRLMLDEEGVPVREPRKFDIANKYFSQLPEELRDRFLEYTFKCDQYLNCDSDEIAYHIIRYNEGKAMSAPQKGITRIGEEFAILVKRIAEMEFFQERGNYTVAEARNGTLERVVVESVMAWKYMDAWNKKQDLICQYLKAHASVGDFEAFEAMVARLDKVMAEDVAAMFDSKNSFLWFGLLARFLQKEGESRTKKRFVSFMREFERTLYKRKVDGKDWKDLNGKATKDKKSVMDKFCYLECLLDEWA